MAIEIKELHVKLHLGDKKPPGPNAESGSGCCDTLDKEEVVEDAVKEVLRILKEQKER